MLLRLMPWFLWLMLVLFSVASYGSIPGDLPRHLDAAGRVTDAVPRSLGAWMLLPIVAALTQALLTGLGRLLPSRPDLFNFPEKDRLLALPREFHGPVVARMRDVLDATGAAVMALLFAVQVVLWRTARGEATPWVTPVVASVTIALVPLILLLTARVSRAVEDAERRSRARASHVR